MKKNTIHEIVDLMFKSWQNTLRAEEEERFAKIMQDDKWRQLKVDLEDDQYVVEHLRRYDEYAGFVDFDSFMNEAKRKRRKSRRKSNLYWGSVASVILVMGIGIFYFFGSIAEQKNDTPLQGGIIAQTGVRLVISDEMMVNLTDVVGSEILDSLGVVVENDVRELDYTNVGTTGEMQYHTLLVPEGQIYKLVLSDGTRVILNADTKIKYPICFEKDKREVFVEGEAYFDVFKNPDAPFMVSGRNFSLEVLGTTFNIMGYADELVSKVTLLTGSVLMNLRDTSFYMQPGEQVAFAENSPASVRSVDGSLSVSWIYDKFYFDNERLDVVLRKICRWYGVDVLYEVSSLRERCFTGTPPNDIPLSELLELLNRVTDIKFTLQGNVIIVRGSN